MATKDQHPDHHANPGRWSGEAVEDQPNDDAEDRAQRAEGNEPVTAEAESRRLHDSDPRVEPQDTRRRPPRDHDPDQDTADAAEDHQARKQAGERPPHGKL